MVRSFFFKKSKSREAVKNKKQRVADIAAKERQTQLVKLEYEMKAFRLFDLGWSVEDAMFKLGISQAEISQHFKVWGEMREEREKVQAELLKKCLRKHIIVLQEQMLWRATKGSREEAKIQLEHCRRMLIDTSRLTKGEKEFLLMEYSYYN